MIRKLPSTFALLASLSLAACRSSEVPSEPKHEYVFVVLRAGPEAGSKTPEQRKEIQAGHMANIERLAKEGPLLIAGPFGQPNPDPKRRGIFVFDVPSVAKAEELTSTDPAVKAGTLAMELHPFTTRTDLHEAQVLDRKFLDANKDKGEGAPPFPMHDYTLALVEGGEKAAKALESRIGNGVVFVGRLGGKSEGTSLVVIDAKDVKAADAVLEPVRGELGKVDATPWWASASLVELAR